MSQVIEALLIINSAKQQLNEYKVAFDTVLATIPVESRDFATLQDLQFFNESYQALWNAVLRLNPNLNSLAGDTEIIEKELAQGQTAFGQETQSILSFLETIKEFSNTAQTIATALAA